MSDYRELLIGCGHARDKRVGIPGDKLEWRGLVTLDQNKLCYPTCIGDLNNVPWRFVSMTSDEKSRVLFKEPDHYLTTFNDGVFDEVHAYEVLEHLGEQGNAQAFFDHFWEIWRVLKPGGYLFATVPSRYSPWLWGDPSHRRAILPESLVFLDQTQYIRQLDGERNTPMSDFRSIYKADFDIVASSDNHEHHIFCLRAVKPSRIKV